MTSKWMGSWIAGPQAAEQQPVTSAHPGELLGFPESGPGAISSLGRRAAQILLDVILSWLVADLIAGHTVNGVRTPYAWASVAVYLGECVLLGLLTGQTAGMRIMGLRIVRLDGRPITVTAAVLRPFLTLLLVPMFFSDRELRTLHDRMTGTAVVRTG